MAVRRVAPVAPVAPAQSPVPLPVLLPALSLALFLLAVSGCGGDPVKPPPSTPSPSALGSSSPTASASPTGPVEPTLPPEAAGEDRAAAKAFVGYYVDLINYAQFTGDVAALRRASTSACTACQAAADSVAKVYADGGRIEGGAWDIADWGRSAPRAGSTFEFVLVIKTNSQKVTQPSASSSNYEGGETTYRIDVLAGSNRWRTTWLETM